MEMQVVKNLGPMFFKLIEDTMRVCPNIIQEERVSDIIDSIKSVVASNDTESDKKYSYRMSLVLTQEMFLCGDEPIDYSPHLPDRLYVIDTMAMKQGSSIIMMRRDYWKMVSTKANMPTIVQYVINDCKDVNPNLMAAQLLADIYERTRYKLVTDYMMLDDCDGLLNQSRILNLQWIEAMLRFVRSSNDFDQKAAYILPSDNVPLPKHFGHHNRTIIIYRSYREEISDNGIQS